ncbi:glutaredoxin family protein [Caldibacillus lycopersici]|uniref:Glutaredoxin family protein n=1 Tax=Perspicuibacillus lycopersici TaxID=1325689 RepID=A0AAE3IRK8_9BACI|nr:glutaredoxin family protein [Perspicuibacillus lycopersici]MCU9612917.1 glutaredoxin family protein [Perspicuibacillus lycopersici]
MVEAVILYTRQGCHLCENAKEILLEIQELFEFQIQEIDIDSSDVLTEKYGLCIPVVEINGEIIQYGNIVKSDLKMYLNEKNNRDNG